MKAEGGWEGERCPPGTRREFAGDPPAAEGGGGEKRDHRGNGPSAALPIPTPYALQSPCQKTPCYFLQHRGIKLWITCPLPYGTACG
jgi:hypothetical protein